MTAVGRLDVSAYRVPTDRPEADGTLEWDSTTLILVEVSDESGMHGLGFSYGAAAAAAVIRDVLAALVLGRAVDDLRASWAAMIRAVRNIGRPGIASTAISAVDIALWDLKARVSGQALCRVLGLRREAVPIYGSGGFTSYSEAELVEQLAGWVGRGIPRVKMKVGKNGGASPQEDEQRVRAARQAIGPDTALFVDANGAYSAKQAIGMAERFADHGVSYFEEPVSSDRLDQLALVRRRAPMDVAAGEYGWDPWYFHAMLAAGAVDILQADVTRCLGVTGWLEAAALAHGYGIPFSGHTAPALHAHVGCAAPEIAHIEYFHDHARIERLLFDGAPEPDGGHLRPDAERPGLGLELKPAEAERWRIPA